MSNHIIISEQRFCYFNSYVIDFIKEILCSNSEIKCSLNLIKKKNLLAHYFFFPNCFFFSFFDRKSSKSSAFVGLVHLGRQVNTVST